MLCRGNRIQHWLNGQLVADVNLAGPEWQPILEKERQRRSQLPAPGPSRDGYLTLSDHTGTAWFRNIRLNLSAEKSSAFRHLSSKAGDLAAPNTGTQQTSATVFDIDRDGVNDFVITERTAAPAVVWYRRTKTGWDRNVMEANPLHIEAGATFADIDGDGDLDFLAGGDYKLNEVWWWENPAPNFDPNVPWKRHVIKNTGSVKHHDQIFADVDGDGKPELIFWNQNGRKLFFARIPKDPRNAGPWDLHDAYSYAADSQMEQRGKAPQSVNEHEGLAIADVDGDGKLDIVGGGRWFKYVGNDKFEAHVIDAGYQFSRAAAGQLIEGGRPEIVFVSGDGEGPLMFYDWVKGTWRSHKLADIRNGHSLALVDFNKDGHLDIFCAEMRLGGANPDAKAYIFLGDGAGNFKQQVLFEGFGNHESRIADLDGDGTLDILGKPYNWETPRLDIWLNRK